MESRLEIFTICIFLEETLLFDLITMNYVKISLGNV